MGPAAAPRLGEAERFMERLKDTSGGAGDDPWDWDGEGEVSSGRDRLDEAREVGKGGGGDSGVWPEPPFSALLLGRRLRSGSYAGMAS